MPLNMENAIAHLAEFNSYLQERLGNQYGERIDGIITFLGTGDPIYRNCPDRLFLYVFYAQSIINNDFTLYNFNEGARSIPMFVNLAQKWPNIYEIGNYEDKITEMCDVANNNIDATIFEILVALGYVGLGYNVSFVPVGNRRTPDLQIEKNGVLRHVECKKMQRGNQYSYKELVRWYAIADGIKKIITETELSGHIHIKFLQVLEKINPKRIFRKIYKKIDVCQSITRPFHITKNKDFKIKFSPINPNLINVDMDPMRHVQGATIIEYLTGSYSPFINYKLLLSGQMYGPYIDRINSASVISGNLDNYKSAQKKAQHAKRKIAEATRQINAGYHGDIHILIEECNGLNTYHERLRNNFQEILSFEDNQEGLERIYLHIAKYIVPLEGLFDVEETVTTFNRNGFVPENIQSVWYAGEEYGEGFGNLMEEWQ
ncbi:hypothetical protein [Pseudodesulfovibrio tunisiensis]|uniref:hypothetical protein n=1 Tax=Pseudodesulfovibrio tunisiensis TaxID=463192 RepID=UPI001FB4C6F9|nr:hypothetical protein [Pseudodesulfovibrio tunisiensis]